MAVVDKNKIKGYHWGDRCEAWALLDTETLSVKQERMPAGSFESRHVHQKAQQFFYVLQGEAAMEIGNERYDLKSGQGIRIPAGRAHRIINESGEGLDFLVISEPTTKEDRTEVC